MIKRKKSPKDFIWTPELAYAVGLLVTDGNLSKDGRHITMRSVEIPMLETFKRCLGLKNKIGVAKKANGYLSYRVQFSNTQFYDWLLKIGVTPAKSLTVGSIDIPKKYFPDYFRGSIDGDGTIQTYRDTYNVYKGRRYATQRLYIRLFSASWEHIIWMSNQVASLADVRGTVIKNDAQYRGRVPIWELKYAKKDSIKLITWMYYSPDVPCLERKKTAACSALDFIQQQSRRTYTHIKK